MRRLHALTRHCYPTPHPATSRPPSQPRRVSCSLRIARPHGARAGDLKTIRHGPVASASDGPRAVQTEARKASMKRWQAALGCRCEATL